MWRTTKKLALRRVPSSETGAVRTPLRGGLWTAPATEYQAGTLTLAVDTLYAMPLYVPVTAFCQAIGISVTTLAAGSNIRMGVYADSGGLPGDLIVDAGVVSGATISEVALALTNWLRPGWYWLAVLTDGTPAVRAVAPGLSLLGHSTNIDSTVGSSGVYVAQAYGALPTPFPTPVTYLVAASGPRPMLLALSGMEEVSDGWRATQAVEEGELLIPPHISGRYYGSSFMVGAFSARVITLVVDTLYAMPFLTDETRAFDRISIQVTTAGAAGKLARLGIYSDSGGLPGALVLDAGTVSVASTGGKEININQTLTPGWYWLVCLSDGTPILRSYEVGTQLGWLGFNTGTDVTYHGGMTVAQAYGALPDPFTPGAALGAVHRGMLRAT